MKAANGEAVPRHMLLALDAMNCEAALIETAAALARALDLELDALFVDDVDVYAVAELPITREISLVSARERAISGPAVTAAVHALAREAEARFHAARERGRPGGRFEVRRARRSEALAEACARVDLLLLVPAGRTVMRLHLPQARDARVFAICGDTPGSARALELAARLVRRDYSELELLASGTLEEARICDLEHSGILVRRRALAAGATLEELLQAVENRPGNTLLLAADLPVAGDRARLLEALAALRCQVLLVN